MQRQYFVIDAFASDRFTGNPAAVVLKAADLEEAEMQAIAAEFNLSETTFVLPPQTGEGDVRFRWFTPTTEVSMCGHATIAGVHALVQSGRVSCAGSESTTLRVDTLSGTLTAFIESIPGEEAGQVIWLELPTPRLVDYPVAGDELSTLLGLPTDRFEPNLPIVKTQDNDLIVFAVSFEAVNDAKPDFGKLRDWQSKRSLRGLCLASSKTLTPSIHVQSRFFAPAGGVDEDPVTGSVHGPLAAYLVEHGLVPIDDNGLAGMQCVQAKAGGRAGVVYALAQRQHDDTYTVRIGGQAVTVMKGALV